MSSSWHDFLFASMDRTGLMTVDKPPLALWVQALSVRVFGFHPLSILVPQALMGVLAVGLARRFHPSLAAIRARLHDGRRQRPSAAAARQAAGGAGVCCAVCDGGAPWPPTSCTVSPRLESAGATRGRP